MSVQTFYLTRHALATHSLTGYGDQILTAEILPEGIPPIEKMSDYLQKIQTDKNFRSEILRCQQTAQIIGSISGKKFIADSRLNEFYQETHEAVQRRVASFLAELEKSHLQCVLLCTHGGIISAIKQNLRGEIFSQENEIDYPPTGVLWKIETQPFSLSAIDFNSKESL